MPAHDEARKPAKQERECPGPWNGRLDRFGVEEHLSRPCGANQVRLRADQGRVAVERHGLAEAVIDGRLRVEYFLQERARVGVELYTAPRSAPWLLSNVAPTRAQCATACQSRDRTGRRRTLVESVDVVLRGANQRFAARQCDVEAERVVECRRRVVERTKQGSGRS